MSVVRPFAARVVRPDRAPHQVTALTDSSPGDEPSRAATDPASYDHAGPAVYAYRQAGDGLDCVGLVCEVAVEAFVDGRVRGHEAVQPARVEALVRRHAVAPAPPALVALIHHAGPAFLRTVETTCTSAPALDFPGPGGLRQTVWRLPAGAATHAVTEELSAAAHYIADGHHRVAAAIEEWRLAGKPPDTGVLCVVHPMGGLRVSAFHRRVAGPVNPSDVLDLLAPSFAVRAVAEAPPPGLGTLGLYVGQRWFEVTYQGPRGDGMLAFDAAILRGRVLDRLERRGSGPSYDVEIAPARTPVAELVRRCDGDGGALFTLAPPALDAITELADAGEVMPPKTTYFEPKPCAGIFLRP